MPIIELFCFEILFTLNHTILFLNKLSGLHFCSQTLLRYVDRLKEYHKLCYCVSKDVFMGGRILRVVSVKGSPRSLGNVTRRKALKYQLK